MQTFYHFPKQYPKIASIDILLIANKGIKYGNMYSASQFYSVKGEGDIAALVL